MNKTEHEQVRNIIARSSPGDYDGHTHFTRLSASQRLDALASLAVFVHECKGRANMRPKTKDQRLKTEDRRLKTED